MFFAVLEIFTQYLKTLIGTGECPMFPRIGKKRVKRTAGYNFILFWGKLDPKQNEIFEF